MTSSPSSPPADPRSPASAASPAPPPESDPRAVRVASAGVGVVRRRVVRTLLALSPVAAALACASSALAAWSSSLAAVAAVVCLTSAVALPLVAALVALIDRTGARRPGHLAVGHGQLVVRRADDVRAAELSVPLAELTAGVYVPTAQRVELTRENGDQLVARVADALEAERVLAAAGLAADQRAVTLPLRGLIGTPVRVLLALMLTSAPTLTALVLALRTTPGAGPFAVLLFLLAQLVVGAATARWFGSPRLVVGADGLAIDHGHRRRFIPYRAIERVELGASPLNRAAYGGLLVHVRGGVVVRLPMVAQSDDAIATACDRIDKAMEGARRSGGGSDGATATGEAALALIERQGRTLAEWRRDLAALLRAPESYRRVHLSRDELLAALHDAGARVERRLAAAMALAVLGDDEAPARIRVAAEASASEPVRVALEKAARDELDDDAIERALAEERRATSAR